MKYQWKTQDNRNEILFQVPYIDGSRLQNMKGRHQYASQGLNTNEQSQTNEYLLKYLNDSHGSHKVPQNGYIIGPSQVVSEGANSTLTMKNIHTNTQQLGDTTENIRDSQKIKGLISPPDHLPFSLNKTLNHNIQTNGNT